MLWANPTPRRVALALADTFVRPWSSNGVAATVLTLAASAFWSRPAAGGARCCCVFRGVRSLRALPPAAPGNVARALRAAARAARGVAGVESAGAGGPGGLRARLRDRGGVPDRRRADVRSSTRASAIRRSASSPTWPVRRKGRRPGPCSPTTPSTARCRPPRRGACRSWPRSATRSGSGCWSTSGAGRRATAWFLADPRRTDLDLFDRRSLQQGRGLSLGRARDRPEFGGARPIGAEWYRLSPPDWVVGEGWSLTPEAGGPGAGRGLRPQSPAHRGGGPAPAGARR